MKESQSPRSSHSPQLKHPNTGSPFDKRKERVKRLDTEEKTNSPLGVRKSDQKLVKDGHDKKKLMGSPLHTRKDKGDNSPRGDRRIDRDKKKRKGEQEKITKGHSSNEQFKPNKTSHQKETEIEEEVHV